MKYSKLVEAALNEVREMSKKSGDAITSSGLAQTQMKLLLTDAHQEHFGVMFLNTRHELIKDEIMFNGTIDCASVYPRMIVKRALDLGASAIILGHNHPSGDPRPSKADIEITNKIMAGCNLMDIKVLDHIIVGSIYCTSMSSEELM